MRLLSKDIFFVLLISIFSFTPFNSISSFAQEGYSEPDYNSVFDYEDSQEDTVRPKSKTKKHISKKSPSLELKDSVFRGGNNMTFNVLIFKVSMIVIALLGVLFFIKRYLSGNQISGAGNILDSLAQKISGNVSAFAQNTIKLKQAMILTPGQNIYLVEVEGKKLLLGGTQQGGVQFLADLTNKTSSKSVLDFKQIEEYQNMPKNQMPTPALNNHRPKEMPVINQAPENMLFAQATMSNMNNASQVTSNGNMQNNNPLPAEKEIYSTNMNIPKQPFKRRTNFRKSLLSDSLQNSDDLAKVR
ncbi:MAG: hypothetical protein A3B68_06780 [Candidatus Melainabacteria bacterium RIFCSPHIGHO2_02_FULL_34_12]|nr:MAG: hypothetical protein A3B68_06780 [Candidatus Melainabacteria bacterium RIFCSPHIGHO2_02_FULL_34_12]